MSQMQKRTYAQVNPNSKSQFLWIMQSPYRETELHVLRLEARAYSDLDETDIEIIKRDLKNPNISDENKAILQAILDEYEGE